MSSLSQERILRRTRGIWSRWFGERRAGHPVGRRDDGIGADVPIRSASQDRLRRLEFADRIAAILSELSLDEGRVFAIRGAWGHGKSSLKNLVVEKLGERKNGAEWLEFNPWQWGEVDAIARALFRQIADKLGGSLSSEAGKRATALRRYGAILTGVGEPLEKAGGMPQAISLVLANASVVTLAAAVSLTLPSATTIAILLALVGVVTPWLGKGLSALGRDHWSEPLDEIRHSLEMSLRKLHQPLVVFVDDIDRLEPDQIRLLFRQIKVNANLPNIVFVLLFQTSIVEAALDPIADGQGREFLEKIVQANFDLPAVPTSMVRTAMTEELTRIAGAYATADNGFQEVRWGNVLIGCILPFVRNLRDSRRFLSSVVIHLPLHVGGAAFEVNIVDFLCLEALRVFEPDFHAALFGERDLLLQRNRISGDRRDDEHRARAHALLAHAGEDGRDTARAALAELFPRLTWAFGGSRYADGNWEAGWIAEKRVCTARFFPRYFELQTPEGELSESDFTDFLAASGDNDRLNAITAELGKRGLIPSVAARLDESVNRLPIESASVLLPAMFDMAQSLVTSRAADPFNSPWVSAWRAISWYIHRLPEAERGPLTLEAFRQTGALSVAAILIHLNSPAEQREREGSEPTLNEDAVEALKDAWLAQLGELAADQEQMLRHPDLGSLLYRWRDYTGSLEAPRSWVCSVTQTDSGFAALVSKLMSSGTTQGMGDRVALRIDSFHRETVDDLIGIRKALSRIDAIDQAQLTPDQVHALQVLRNHIGKWVEREPVGEQPGF